MNKKQAITIIDKVANRVQKDISAFANQGGKYARGLAGESYNGGYRDALHDVMLLLNDVTPNRNYRWWDDE